MNRFDRNGVATDMYFRYHPDSNEFWVTIDGVRHDERLYAALYERVNEWLGRFGTLLGEGFVREWETKDPIFPATLTLIAPVLELGDFSNSAPENGWVDIDRLLDD